MIWLKKTCQFFVIVLIASWLGVFVWTHQPFGFAFTIALLCFWLAITLVCLLTIFLPKLLKTLIKKSCFLAFFSSFILAIIILLAMQPSNNRDWNPEVAQILDYNLDEDGNTVTVYNIRNFDWLDEKNYQQKWEARQYQLDKLQSIDFVASYWMGEPIAHTLLSFGFDDGQYLAFL